MKNYQRSVVSGQLSAISLLAVALLLPLSAVAAEDQKAKDVPEKIYIVNEYRFVPGSSADDQEIGHSLCGTRCNALSSSFNNILEPGGWSLVRISSNKEITVELKNPFLGGQCICLADEYSVKVMDPGGPRTQRPYAQGKANDKKP